MNMKWTKDRSIKLSLFCICFFAAALLVLDIYFCISGRRVLGRFLYRDQITVFTIVFIICSIFAWICLYHLFRLLKNLDGETVFNKANVAHLRTISWCCAGVAAATFAGCFSWGWFFIVTAASGFMMLIVRIVKNVIEEAIDMKDELDYTV